MAIVGPRDAETRKVSVRLHGKAENAGELGFDEFVKTVAEEATTRGACTLAQRMLA
jgi:threonyl-tRNA synthetase